MDVAVPCRCVFPGRGQEAELFQPGILFESEDGTRLGSVSLLESSRYEARGFWKRLGFNSNRIQFDRTRFAVILELGGSPVWTLQGRAKSWYGVTSNQVFTSSGEPAGFVKIKRQALRVWSDSTRATFCDERDVEVGYYDQSGSLISGTFRFVDSKRDWTYEIEYDGQRGEWGFIRCGQANVIDSRLLLAWCYYAAFYYEPD